MPYRPYPAPDSPYVMHMGWHNLLFMHWRVPVATLRPHIPTALPIDTFDGCAWIAVVPFYMRDVRPRFTPSVPTLSNFVELNVRTYVTVGGKPGVWFVSLDCENAIAVRLARRLFHLPYMDAHMSCVPTPLPAGEGLGAGGVVYQSHRTHRNEAPAKFAATYRPIGPIFHAQPGTLEYFLTARYCFYSADVQGNIYRCEVDHVDWPLQSAEADVQHNTMTDQIGLTLPNEPPHLLFAKQIDVVAWLPEKVTFDA
jgi:uncharacterized protein YqjF (DUF2071 family)